LIIQQLRRQEDHVGMQYPFWYVLAHRRGERYDLTPLYIGGVHIYGLYGTTAITLTPNQTIMRLSASSDDESGNLKPAHNPDPGQYQFLQKHQYFHG
jgi:hypothetical protein